MNVPIWLWGASVATVLVLLAIDLLTSRSNEAPSMKQAWVKSGIWVSIGVSFGFVILALYSPEYAAEYWSGFLTEKALSIDNVFVWALIFTSFNVPRRFQYRVLFLGVLGAIVLRAIFIAVGAQLIHSFAWVLYLFAAFLIYSGIRMLIGSGHDSSPQDSKFLKLFTRVFRTTDDFHDGKFLVKIDGKRFATRLLVVLALVEFTDVLFAVDSIPAVFAVTDEPYIVFTSNVFALLGLRSLYFVLADLV
ncbi:MAG: TerC/Alx family metal homeostasis membrane protein, partial [Micrococcales bacterium]